MFLPFQVAAADQSLFNRNNGTSNSLDFPNIKQPAFNTLKECSLPAQPIVSQSQGPSAVQFSTVRAPHVIVTKQQVINFTETLSPGATFGQKSVTIEEITVDERILSLSGVFHLLSHCYAMPIVIHRKRYRSVEHYVCQKFFKSLGFNAKAMEKLITTTDPRKLPSIVAKILGTQFPPIPDDVLADKQNRMTDWYKTAVAKKFETYPILQRILLSTGNAFLVETNNLDDKIMSVGIPETELHHIMTKCDTDPEKLLLYMLQPKECNLHRFRKIGLNKTGIILMKLRNRLRHDGGEDKQPIVYSLFDRTPVVSPLDYESENCICFTCESVLHPKFLAPVWYDNCHIIYPSVDHFVFTEGAKFLGFPDIVVQNIMNCSSNDVRYIFFEEVWNRFPDPEKYFEWWSFFYDDAMKNACRTKFEKHPELMRLLLETIDSLLFYCHRFTTMNGDWSTGMRESELREWKTRNRYSNANITDLMLDCTKRPPFLGGNRLGFILMELRREFRMKGYLSQSLPLLPASANNNVLYGEGPMILQLKERNVAVWYPGKRHLVGYYDEGFSPELKRPADLRGVFIHPEYSASFPVGKAYSVSPEIFNLTNLTDPLKSMLSLLLKGTKQLVSEIGQHEDSLNSLFSRLYDRNNFKIEDKSIPLVGHQTDAAVTKSLISSARTNAFHLSPKNPKFLALEEGFLSTITSVIGKNNNSFGENRLDFEDWDDKRITAVLEHLYSHLNHTERQSAFTWFKLTVNKLKAIKLPSAALYLDNNYKTFVPLAKKKSVIGVPKFFKADDS